MEGFNFQTSLNCLKQLLKNVTASHHCGSVFPHVVDDSEDVDCSTVFIDRVGQSLESDQGSSFAHARRTVDHNWW
jgi:hypothetical protein